MTERISLKETYDNRDVIAWLVQQKAQIDDILTRIEDIETIPENMGSDLRPIRRDNGQFIPVSKNLVQADNVAVGTDTQPIKIVNGEAVPVGYDLISSEVADQTINGVLHLNRNLQTQLYLKRNIDISTVAGSTALCDILFLTDNGSTSDYMHSRIQTRRYANRTRFWITLYRLTNGDETAIMFEQYDNGRVALLVNNIVNGVATQHSIIDSTP